MKKVTAWEAEDGSVFTSFEEGKEYEAELEEAALVANARTELKTLFKDEDIHAARYSVEQFLDILTGNAGEIIGTLSQLLDGGSVSTSLHTT